MPARRPGARRQPRPSPRPPGLPCRAARRPPAATTATRKVEDVRPAVYRYGKLPKEAPSWFTELDTDKDGQIGLYEWRKAGRPMSEFAEMDLNNDGFVTAEEWLRCQRLTQEKAHHADLVAAVSEGGVAASASASSSKSGGRGMWGGPPREAAATGGDAAAIEKSEKGEKGDSRDKKSSKGKRGPSGGYRPPGR